MLKKWSVWLLCALCLLTAATGALADEEPTASEELPPVSDVQEPSLDESEPIESDLPSELSLIISPVFSDTDLLLTVTDETGVPVANIPLSFDVGATVNMVTAFTNADGAAALSIVGIDPGTEIVCHSAETYDGSVTYLSAEIAVIVPGEVPTTPAPTTTETEAPTAPTEATTMAPLPTLPTTESTGTTRSMPTYAEVRGATTTRMQGDSVYTNLLVDQHLLDTFGYSIQKFDASGHLMLDKATYATLTDTYGSHLFGKLTTSVLSDVTTDQIRSAKTGVAGFADCKAENAVAVTFAVSLQFLEESGSGLPVTDASSLGSDLMFEFSIPVPKSMEKCKTFGIAMTGENVLNPLTPVAVKNGAISFRTPALGHFTLVGFTDGTAAASPLGTIMWVLIGLGVLVLALTGFLIYRFFIRDRGEEDDPDDDLYTDYDGDLDGDGNEPGEDDGEEPPIPIRLK